MKFSIKKLTTMAMFAALAYVIMVFVRIPLFPAASFLEYDPKDIFFVMTGFLLGPVESLIIIVLVCLIEMVTVSTSGPIGLLMNVIASVCFVLPAALIYNKKKNLVSAVLGLLAGVFCMTGAMLLWNFIVTPWYMHVSRDVVTAMLPTVFLPFNMIKASINMAFTLIIYKPVSTVLHKTGLVEARAKKAEEIISEADKKEEKKKFTPIAILAGILILAMCAAALILLNGN